MLTVLLRTSDLQNGGCKILIMATRSCRIKIRTQDLRFDGLVWYPPNRVVNTKGMKPTEEERTQIHHTSWILEVGSFWTTIYSHHSIYYFDNQDHQWVTVLLDFEVQRDQKITQNFLGGIQKLEECG